MSLEKKIILNIHKIKDSLSLLNKKIYSRLIEIDNYQYYESFFDFSKLTLKRFKDFINNSRRLRQGSITFKQIIIDFYNKFIIDSSDNFDATLENIFKDEELCKKIADLSVFKIFLQYLLKYALYASLDEDCSRELELSNEKALQLFEPKNNVFKIFFRGQANNEWDLKPSLYRNIDCPNCKQGYYFNVDSIYNLYLDSNLIDKYNMNDGIKKINSAKDLNYDFLALMQHSISFSPFIDFTHNLSTATTFALRKNEPYLFKEKSCCVFQLYANDNVIISNINDLNNIDDYVQNTDVRYINGKILIGCKMKIHNIFNSDDIMEIDFSSYSEIIKTLQVKAYVIDIPSNDRMKRQNGVFLYLNNYYIINNRIFSFFNDDIFIVKFNFDYNYKQYILSNKSLFNIDENTNYTNLMDPYSIFND